MLDKSKLLEKAKNLPKKPGVYKMLDKNGKIIYVGKSKALKNRVMQYFQNISHHNSKTFKMVSAAEDFECIFTDTELEAFVLENELIKLHSPKYNIKLKDDKRYPYLKLTLSEKYPRLVMVRKREDTKGDLYFGPYTSTATVYGIINLVRDIFKLPSCKKKFPRDIGAERPCLNYHIKKCMGVCTGNVSEEEYAETVRKIKLFLNEDYTSVLSNLHREMTLAAENLEFEKAAKYRDMASSLENLKNRQKIVSSPDVERDVFGIWSDELSTCLSVMIIRGGRISDTESFIFSADEIMDGETFPSFLLNFYKVRDAFPREIVINSSLKGEEGSFDFRTYVKQNYGKSLHLIYPERGELKKLCALADENAREYLLHKRAVGEKSDTLLYVLAYLLCLEVVPEKIEAIDISNSGSEFSVAGIISIKDGSFSKKDYRSYNIKESSRDDYSAMCEALRRRVSHGDLPDLFLLDGGQGHLSVVGELFQSLSVDVPVFGMVKDDYHKTRSLVSEGGEISIAKNKTIYEFIYKIQEEVHRYTFSLMDRKRNARVKRSELENIEGIGPKKAKILLKNFGSVKNIKAASIDTLCAAKGISHTDAEKIYRYFRQ